MLFTEIDELMPHLVADVATCREFGAAVIRLVPKTRGLRLSLAREAARRLGKTWTYETIQTWLVESRHTEEYRQQVNATTQDWKQKNPEQNKAANQDWKQRNPEYHKEYNCQRRKVDPAFRIAETLRARMQGALNGTCKSARTMKLVGCTIKFLMEYLEAQFLPGMSWENYGSKWHVDHSQPCSSFDLTDPAQQRQCFHYSNLQPMWAADNISKGAKSMEDWLAYREART